MVDFLNFCVYKNIWIKRKKSIGSVEPTLGIYLNKLIINYSFLIFLVLHTSASLAINESWDPNVR